MSPLLVSLQRQAAAFRHDRALTGFAEGTAQRLFERGGGRISVADAMATAIEYTRAVRDKHPMVQGTAQRLLVEHAPEMSVASAVMLAEELEKTIGFVLHAPLDLSLEGGEPPPVHPIDGLITGLMLLRDKVTEASFYNSGASAAFTTEPLTAEEIEKLKRLGWTDVWNPTESFGEACFESFMVATDEPSG